MRKHSNMNLLVSYSMFCLMFLVSLHPIPSCKSQAVAGNATDLHALLSFKAHISDPLGNLASWNQTETPAQFCNWPGVRCGAAERVTGLSLDSLNLTGTISPYLSNLTSLHILNLSTNSFHGRIPWELGRLSDLQFIDLGNNNLQGDVPLSLTHCSKLRSIVLNDNSLIGHIPQNLSQCHELSILRLYDNQLTGTIPASIGSLQKLKRLDLGNNQLIGGIPQSFGNLSSLMFLELSLNGLSGEIPASLFNISSIYYFDIGSNYNLSGVLPHDMGSTLPDLKYFFVFYNQLRGAIPVSLANASRLQIFEIHGNMFTGHIPENLGSLVNLTTLDIGWNWLEGKDLDFITSLSNCSNLRILDITRNTFHGAIPSSVGNLSTKLRWMRLAGNQISGIIPPEIGRLGGLTNLDMASNLITGTIPSTIGMLQILNHLDFSDNQLHGEIPTTIGNLTQLSRLSLGWNQLQGSIPSSIGNLVSLGALNLSRNDLNGTIPGQALSKLSSLSQFLDLSHNKLTGHLPLQISSLINLNILDVSENRLCGEIPNSIGQCQVLEQLFMQGNFFEGIIPSAMSELKGMEQVDLSCNNLSGPIPEYFGRFMFLYNLNLSFNDLEGQVPRGGVFGNASAISVLGNNKLCSGDTKLHLPLCRSFDRRSTHRPSLLKVVIILVAATTFIILVFAAYYIWKPRKQANPPDPYMRNLFLQISYDDIHKATGGFSSSNIIGVGSFGCVYKGIVDSDLTRIVAIKVIKLNQRGASRSFMAECESMRAVQHRNLVNIITVCSSIDHNGDDFKALIFEYMPNGSLNEWLHPRKDDNNGYSKSLDLVQRWNIVMDVALALDYLHHQCHTPIVHCDLKPSNVLMDYDMSAHVGDFGLSRFLQDTSLPQDTNSLIGIRGSIGYIAPEYGTSGIVSTKGDVYSYGILLLETFTGQSPIDDMFQGDLNLHKYVEMAYPDRVMDIIEPSIIQNIDGKYAGETTEFAVSILRIGLLCSRESPNERMEMGDVVKELLLAKKLLDGDHTTS